ncbi:MAG: ATP-binding protein [Chlamydiae bacterium]|nr:ATP-binding protein [Chlamydiota bacterium]MBI3277307.1 ATP-binding protein [Chlamydiota bacterium]
MKRSIENYFLKWKMEKDRRPLLVRGARQIGKSFTINKFGKENFRNHIEINFEFRPEFKSIFQTLDPQEILRKINLMLNVKIHSGEDLLFLDEIQECPQAIGSLRYFYEKMPELHVIAAGSLLEFSLSSGLFEVPVGRIQYLYMNPLSFDEFLEAIGELDFMEYLRNLNVKKVIDEALHQKGLKLLRDYLVIGGMPAALKSYVCEKESGNYQRMQLLLLQTYRDDFGKYANKVKHLYLQKVFARAPFMVGEHYKYVNVDREIPSRELKEALHLLTQAGVISKICATSGHGLPFSVHSNENKFKILFLDGGLLQRSCGLDVELGLTDDFLAVNSGSLAEQFVGQELIAYGEPYERGDLYFWKREKIGSNAEVDYLVRAGSQIVPIEVKSGVTGKLKSLKLFMGAHSSKLGVRFSQLPLSFHEKILSLPLYAVQAMPKLMRELL